MCETRASNEQLLDEFKYVLVTEQKAGTFESHLHLTTVRALADKHGGKLLRFRRYGPAKQLLFLLLQYGAIFVSVMF